MAVRVKKEWGETIDLCGSCGFQRGGRVSTLELGLGRGAKSAFIESNTDSSHYILSVTGDLKVPTSPQ